MIEPVIMSICQRILNLMSPLAGSVIHHDKATVVTPAPGTDYSVGVVINRSGKGELQSIGWRASSGAITSGNRVSALEITVDGGTPFFITALGGTDGAATGAAAMSNTAWLPIWIPFNTSILVRAITTVTTGSVYVYGMTRINN